jgi:hypothetical protein
MLLSSFEFQHILLNNDTLSVSFETRRRDAEMMTAKSDSTGLVSWPSATLLANILVSKPRLVMKSRTILEMGCGAALLSSAIAAFLSTNSTATVHNNYYTIIATDGVESVLPLAKRNLDANTLAHGKNITTITENFRWGSYQDELSLTKDGKVLYDLIIASECFYLKHGRSNDESGKGGVYSQAMEFFTSASRLVSPCTCNSNIISSTEDTTTTTTTTTPKCTAGILLVIYAPRYRNMGPQIKSAAKDCGLICLALTLDGLIREKERNLHLCYDSRLLLLSKCSLAAITAMNDIETKQGEEGFDDDHYPEWNTSTLPPL